MPWILALRLCFIIHCGSSGKICNFKLWTLNSWEPRSTTRNRPLSSPWILDALGYILSHVDNISLLFVCLEKLKKAINVKGSFNSSQYIPGWCHRDLSKKIHANTDHSDVTDFSGISRSLGHQWGLVPWTLSVTGAQELQGYPDYKAT